MHARFQNRRDAIQTQRWRNLRETVAAARGLMDGVDRELCRGTGGDVHRALDLIEREMRAEYSEQTTIVLSGLAVILSKHMETVTSECARAVRERLAGLPA